MRIGIGTDVSVIYNNWNSIFLQFSWKSFLLRHTIIFWLEHVPIIDHLDLQSGEASI